MRHEVGTRRPWRGLVQTGGVNGGVVAACGAEETRCGLAGEGGARTRARAGLGARGGRVGTVYARALRGAAMAMAMAEHAGRRVLLLTRTRGRLGGRRKWDGDVA